MACKVTNCERADMYARQMCRAHYEKWLKCGDPAAGHGNLRHGHIRDHKPSRTYRSWQNMVTRCTNPKSPRFKDYGARGITVCERWRESFEAFLADMGEAPEGKSIERRDNNGNYEQGNCRWATRKEQGQNTRSNRLLTVDGRTQCLKAWAEEVGLKRETLRKRLDLGWGVKRAVYTPCGEAARP